MGIFVNHRTHAVRADRLGGVEKPSKDKHYSYQWEVIKCKDTYFVGRFFPAEAIQAGGWPNGTTFKSKKTNKEKRIVCPDYLPGFDEVPDEG